MTINLLKYSDGGPHWDILAAQMFCEQAVTFILNSSYGITQISETACTDNMKHEILLIGEHKNRSPVIRTLQKSGFIFPQYKGPLSQIHICCLEEVWRYLKYVPLLYPLLTHTLMWTEGKSAGSST